MIQDLTDNKVRSDLIRTLELQTKLVMSSFGLTLNFACRIVLKGTFQIDLRNSSRNILFSTDFKQQRFDLDRTS